MPLGGALIAGIPSLVQLGAGISQKYKANNLKKSNYVPPQLLMNKDLAMQQAYSRRAPGAAFAEEQNRRLAANQIAGAQRMFGGDANKIAAISSGAVAGAQDANKSIASQGQAFSENAFGKLSNANIALANNDRQNQSDYLQTKNALDNAGNTNIFGGISNLSTAALAGLASKGNVGAKAQLNSQYPDTIDMEQDQSGAWKLPGYQGQVNSGLRRSKLPYGIRYKRLTTGF